MTYSPPAIWGSGITWGSFTWGAAFATSGPAYLYASLDGVPLTVAQAARWRIGRSDWFDVLSPSTASVTVTGSVTVTPNQKLMLSTDAGLLWTGWTDEASTATDANGFSTTTITATDIIGRLGVSIKAPGKIYAGPTLQYRWFPIGYYGDLLAVVAQYLADYAPDLSIAVTEGDSTGTLPALTSWFFSAPGPAPKKTLLELLNQAELSSNAVLSLTPAGDLVATMRYPVGSATVVDLDGYQGAWTRTRGRSSVINHWIIEEPETEDNTVLDSSDAASIALYGERTMELTDYLSTTAAHFPTAFRDALAAPRYLIPSATFPIGDSGHPALLLSPLSWVTLDGDTWQVMSVEHDVTPDRWTVTLSLDASQNALSGEPEP